MLDQLYIINIFENLTRVYIQHIGPCERPAALSPASSDAHLRANFLSFLLLLSLSLT